MSYTQGACCLKQQPEFFAQESNSSLQHMEKCFIQDFKHRQTFWDEDQMAQYVQQRLLFPAVNNAAQINQSSTLQRIQAICGAAYRTKIPLNMYALWYVQNQAEQSGATQLATFMQNQSERFKKVHIWLKCNPLAHMKRMWLLRK